MGRHRLTVGGFTMGTVFVRDGFVWRLEAAGMAAACLGYSARLWRRGKES